jgi:hypothetical protein
MFMWKRKRRGLGIGDRGWKMKRREEDRRLGIVDGG